MKLNHAQGAAGEEQALQFLQQQGCKLLARNWHCPFGEIDLIVKYENILIFVEVKYRKNQSFGGAAYSITPSKLRKLQTSIALYIQQHNICMPCRLDAILIEGNSKPIWLQNLTG